MAATKLTAGERGENARRNGRLSRGPTSEAGKNRTRQNAIKDGLRTKTIPLPNENQEIVAARGDLWHLEYQPQSLAAIHFTNECAQATLVADRCARYSQAEIEIQVEKAAVNYTRQQRRRVAKLVQRLGFDTKATMEQFKSFAAGLRWTTEQWEELLEAFRWRGCLKSEEFIRAINLFGVRYSGEAVCQDVMAYTTYLDHLGCDPELNAAQIEKLLRPENRPTVMQELPIEEVSADEGQSRELLEMTMMAEIEKLQAEEERLLTEFEDAEYRRALDAASILTDEAARRVNRSHAESRTTFQRAFKGLVETLKSDAAEGRGERSAMPIAELAPEPDYRREPIAEPSVEVPSNEDVPTVTGDAVGLANEPGADVAEAVEVRAANEAAAGGWEPGTDGPKLIRNEPSLSAKELAQVAERTRSSDEGRPSVESRPQDATSPKPGGREGPTPAATAVPRAGVSGRVDPSLFGSSPDSHSSSEVRRRMDDFEQRLNERRQRLYEHG